MWRKRRLFRITMLGTFALVVIYYSTTQLSTLRYRTRRKAGTGHFPALLVHEAVYVWRESTADPQRRHAFNARASDRLRSDRALPDSRHPRCRSAEYAVPDDAAVSVVVTFHNEARSALLRTVVSVLNRTPSDLLLELLLVDDFSDDEQDGALLASLPKVRLLRNDQRQGLIRSRVRGAEAARGEFVAFLDSHCEVNAGWLEPLLDRVAQDPLVVASPVIDIIDMETFQYRSSSSQLKGGFDWSLHFKWIPLTVQEKSKRSDTTEPFLSPVIAGGLFLVQRQWFQQLGMFDKGLEIWGAENLEISLKVWLCGGRLEVVPCSRVGHVFRKKHPYSFPDGNANTYLRNTKRIAEVWLDDYKRFFYEARPNAKEIDAGSLEDQLRIKEELSCKPFQWYMENIYPELKMPNEESSAFGQVRQGSGCLGTGEGGRVRVGPCAEAPAAWSLSARTHALRLHTLCLSAPSPAHTPGTAPPLLMQPCRQALNQKWSRQGRALVLLSSGRCLESGLGNEVRMAECRRGALTQQWDFAVELQTQDNAPINIT